MLATSDANRPNGDEGVTIRNEVPEANRAETDVQSILALSLTKREDTFYKLIIKTGI